MKLKNYFAIICVLSVLTNTIAQDTSAKIRLNFCVNSPKGVYVHLINQRDFESMDSNYVKNIQFFTIQRFEINTKEPDPNKIKKIAVVRPAQSIGELLKYITHENIEELKKNLHFKTDEQVVQLFNTMKSPNRYGPYYQLIQTQLAAGHVFFDEDVKENKLYQYIVTAVDKNNVEKTWSTCRVDRKIFNPSLQFFKPVNYKIVTYDSAIIYYWYVLTKNLKADSIKLNFVKNNPKNTASNFIAYPIQLAQGTAIASVNEKFQPMQKLIPQLNTTGDTLFFSYELRTMPKNIHSCYIQLTDPAQNIGLCSDTQTAIALSKKSIPLLYGIKAEDIIDGIKLTWKKLPNEPWIKGVYIYRTSSTSKYDSIGYFGLEDTTFTDYKIEIGQTYQYFAKAIYHHVVKVKQEAPAQAVGQYTKFTPPNKPTDFNAENKGKNILLTWNYQTQKSFYGFYIYRGTSEKKLSVIAGPIHTNYYLDTSVSLSGRSKYFYSVLTQNLRQDTSQLCTPIAIMPNRPIEMTNNIDIKFYYANGKLYLNWNDVRKLDNAIENYILQKRLSKDSTFHFLSNSFLSGPEYIDSSFKAGDSLVYRVAPVSFRGDTGKFGNEALFILQLPPVDIINNFTIVNQENGVEIILEKMRKTSWKSFIIYRQSEKETELKKIATIPSNQFNFRDKSVIKGTKYAYYIAVVELDNREGKTGESRSILYNPIKVTNK